MSEQLKTEQPEEPSQRQRNWGCFLIPMILLAVPVADIGATLIQYANRTNVIKQVIKPGMNEKEVLRVLKSHRFVTGIGQDCYYVEVKTRRPYLAKAGIFIGQKLGKLPAPWHRLLPLEQCLVLKDNDGAVKEGDYFSHWFW